MPRSGRPRVLSKTDKRFIIRQIKIDPKTSAPKITAALENRGVHVAISTVRNVCHKNGYHGRVVRKKFWINETNRKKRLEFAKQHLNKSQEYWNTVLFSDESKFNIFNSDGRRTVWRKKNTELDPKNLIPTVKHGGGSVLVWGCMSATGVGKLHIINGIMDHKMYIEILKENLHVSTQKLEISDNYIFQHDNDPKHTAYNTKQWLLYNVPKQLHTPPQSPDLNPIEHLWGILKDAIKKRHISNREDLKIALQEEWKFISPTITRKLVESMHRRLLAVISAKGYPTKY